MRGEEKFSYLSRDAVTSSVDRLACKRRLMTALVRTRMDAEKETWRAFYHICKVFER